VAKVESDDGDLLGMRVHRVQPGAAEAVATVCDKNGAVEQRIKEGKLAVN
jgi:hypothetical protein